MNLLLPLTILLLTLLANRLHAADSSQCSTTTTEHCDSTSTDIATLRNGVEMPLVGFGIAGMRGETTKASVLEHLRRGFRLIDGAEALEWYDDRAAGEALASNDLGIKREEVFIVTKIHPKNLGREKTLQAFSEVILRNWRTDRIDLLLLHYPECGSWIPDCKGKSGGDWKGSWRALEELYEQGKVRAIGVCNVDENQLTEFLRFANVAPHVVQNWMDPFHQDGRVRELCARNGIQYQAYSSLGTQWQWQQEVNRNLVFASRTLRKLAEKYGVPVTNVVLSWLLEKRVAVIPRSENRDHIAENARLLNATSRRATVMSDPQDVATIDALDGVFDARTDCESRLAGERDDDESARVKACKRDKELAKGCRATCAGRVW